MDFLIAALSIGFIGSFHCLGMCGPIAFALPIKKKNKLFKLLTGLVYNFGRISSYCLFGLLFGILGQGISMASSQQTISIAIGIIFILSLVISKSLLNKINPTSNVNFFIKKLKNSLSKLLKSSSLKNLYLIGLLNGLLPCGLVYAAIGGSIATGNAINGALFMIAFGLGTFPTMLSAVALSNFITIKFRNKLKKLIPIFIFIMGCLFILRGLNLGIPYLSPKINIEKPFIQECAN